MYFVVPEIKNHTAGKNFKDYKTKLQEIIQRNPGETLQYEVVDVSGPDHNRHFVVEVHLNSNVIGKVEEEVRRMQSNRLQERLWS